MIRSSGAKIRTDEKVLVECDFKISTKCKGTYLKVYKNILKGRLNNNGKDRCQYCFNSQTKTGKNNFNYRIAKDENFFESIDSELKAYLLGWIAGDGCVKKDGLYLENHIVDVGVLQLFIDHISPDTKFYKKSGERGINTLCLKIHSSKLVQDICYHLDIGGPGKKSHKINMSKISADLQKHYIRGLIDSDGSIFSPFKISQTYPTATYCSASKIIKKQIVTFCNNNNIKVSNNGLHANPSIVWKGINCIKFLSLIYDSSEYYLQRKKCLYTIWSTWMPYNTESMNKWKENQ